MPGETVAHRRHRAHGDGPRRVGDPWPGRGARGGGVAARGAAAVPRGSLAATPADAPVHRGGARHVARPDRGGTCRASAPTRTAGARASTRCGRSTATCGLPWTSPPAAGSSPRSGASGRSTGRGSRPVSPATSPRGSTQGRSRSGPRGVRSVEPAPDRAAGRDRGRQLDGGPRPAGDRSRRVAVGEPAPRIARRCRGRAAGEHGPGHRRGCRHVPAARRGRRLAPAGVRARAAHPGRGLGDDRRARDPRRGRRRSRPTSCAPA